MHLALWHRHPAPSLQEGAHAKGRDPAEERRMRNFEQLNRSLIDAVLEGNLRKTKHFLKKGADVNARDTRGRTPLMLINTVKTKHVAEICETLLDKGADVHATDILGMTELMWASVYGHTYNCMLIMDGKAEINATSKSGMTALMWAARNGHVGTCEFLIERGADAMLTNNKGMTALMWAEEKGHDDAAEVLRRAESLETGQ